MSTEELYSWRQRTTMGKVNVWFSLIWISVTTPSSLYWYELLLTKLIHMMNKVSLGDQPDRLLEQDVCIQHAWIASEWKKALNSNARSLNDLILSVSVSDFFLMSSSCFCRSLFWMTMCFNFMTNKIFNLLLICPLFDLVQPVPVFVLEPRIQPQTFQETNYIRR